MRPLLLLALLAAPAPAADAPGVVVLANAMPQPVRFELTAGAGEARVEELEAGETRAYAVGAAPQVAYAVAGKPDAPQRYALDPDHAYAFVAAPAAAGGGVAFQGIEFAAPWPAGGRYPDKAGNADPHTLRVALALDAADPRQREAWEKALRALVADASAVLERQVNVRLRVAAAVEWPVDAEAKELPAAARDLARRVPKGEADLVLGFSGRKFEPLEVLPAPGGEQHGGPLGERFAFSKGVFATHIVLCDGRPKTQAERVEVLVAEVARALGAAGSADPGSAMRHKLGDGRAVSAKFRVQLDPVNALAVSLGSRHLRRGVKSWADLSAPERERLEVVYKTLAAIDPKDPAAGEHLDLLARLRNPGADVAAAPPAPAVEVAPKPEMPAPAPPRDASEEARRDAARQVLRAIRERAKAIQALPEAERPKGDALAGEYLRAAAKAAQAAAATTTPAAAASAFLLGVGVGLDDSTALRNNIVTRELVRSVESEAERRDRLAVLGAPSLRGRRDLCQHFAVSAALTDVLGPGAAEAAGVAKEVFDLAGQSGFSFVDLAADLAGIRFAERLKADPKSLADLAAEFDADAALPPTAGLREGLTAKKFEADYGGISDPRFKAELEAVRKRVDDHVRK